jgi:flagellar motor switch protein FliN/FliY
MSSADDALLKLGQSTGEAVSGVLEMFAPGQVAVGSVDVVAADHHPLEGISVPAVLTSVSYIDGVTGGNLFAISLTGARKLAAALMGMEAEASSEELSELELSAVAEAMNQVMASAALATGEVLGTEVQIGVPGTKTFASADAAVAQYERTPHAVRVVITVCGEQCRLIQLVPNAFVVRMSRALHELGAEYADGGASSSGSVAAAVAGSATGAGVTADPHSPMLAGIPVRVWAELGRAQMPSRRSSACPPARSSSSIASPTSSSTSSSTACGSLQVG